MAEKEYIEREKALAFQNEVEPLLCRNVVTHDIMSATKDADLVKYLQSIPAADVWEVVHCADCAHAEESLVNGCVYCNEMERARIKEGFCAWGERKES